MLARTSRSPAANSSRRRCSSDGRRRIRFGGDPARFSHPAKQLHGRLGRQNVQVDQSCPLQPGQAAPWSPAPRSSGSPAAGAAPGPRRRHCPAPPAPAGRPAASGSARPAPRGRRECCSHPSPEPAGTGPGPHPDPVAALSTLKIDVQLQGVGQPPDGVGIGPADPAGLQVAQGPLAQPSSVGHLLLSEAQSRTVRPHQPTQRRLDDGRTRSVSVSLHVPPATSVAVQRCLRR